MKDDRESAGRGVEDSMERQMREAAETAQDLASQARERFIGDLQTLSEHAQELLRVTSTISEQGVAAAREHLMQSLDDIGESLKRWQGEAMTQTRRLAERTDSYVHENPWPAIGAGVLVGVALGVAGGSLTRAGGGGSGARH